MPIFLFFLALIKLGVIATGLVWAAEGDPFLPGLLTCALVPFAWVYAPERAQMRRPYEVINLKRLD